MEQTLGHMLPCKLWIQTARVQNQVPPFQSQLHLLAVGLWMGFSSSPCHSVIAGYDKMRIIVVHTS